MYNNELTQNSTEGIEVSQSANDKVLETVLSKLDYTMLKDVLIKPLAPIMVTKEIQVPKTTGEKDDTGADIYDGTETVTEEFESSFREGVVLAIPTDIETKYSVGDVVIFHVRSAAYFELFKDTMLVKPYDVIAVKNVA
jgi:hypothetical protein